MSAAAARESTKHQLGSEASAPLAVHAAVCSDRAGFAAYGSGLRVQLRSGLAANSLERTLLHVDPVSELAVVAARQTPVPSEAEQVRPLAHLLLFQSRASAGKSEATHMLFEKQEAPCPPHVVPMSSSISVAESRNSTHPSTASGFSGVEGQGERTAYVVIVSRTAISIAVCAIGQAGSTVSASLSALPTLKHACPTRLPSGPALHSELTQRAPAVQLDWL